MKCFVFGNRYLRRAREQGYRVGFVTTTGRSIIAKQAEDI